MKSYNGKKLKEPKVEIKEVNKPNKAQQKVLDLLAKLVTNEELHIGKRGNQITLSNPDDLYERFVILFCTNEKEHWGWHNIKSEGVPTMGIRLITENMLVEYHFSEKRIEYACGLQAHFFKDAETICNCRQAKRKLKNK